MEKFLKKAGWESVVTSIIFVIIGAIMAMYPNTTLQIISKVFGIIFIIVGAIKIIEFCISKKEYDFYNYELIYGLIAIILGFVTMTYSNTIETIFRIMIGMWIVYSGFVRCSLAIKLNKVSVNSWVAVIIIALLMVICGLYIIFCPGTLIVTLGILICAYAIMELIESLIFIKNVDKIF